MVYGLFPVKKLYRNKDFFETTSKISLYISFGIVLQFFSKFSKFIQLHMIIYVRLEFPTFNSTF